MWRAHDKTASTSMINLGTASDRGTLKLLGGGTIRFGSVDWLVVWNNANLQEELEEPSEDEGLPTIDSQLMLLFLLALQSLSL